MRLVVSLITGLFLSCGAVQAGEAEDMDALLEALRINDAVEIMRAEGLVYGNEIAADMLPETSEDAWAAQLSRIYDTDRLAGQVSTRLAEALAGTDLAPLVAFMTSETGREIVALEISAREAFLDPATEDAAFASYEAAKEEQTILYRKVQVLIEDSALVDFNVMGALNANLMFYRGLEDGGAIEMGESEMLKDVWAQEDAVRAESESWLGAFLMMAYRPLDPDALEAYTAFYRTPEGQALNAAIFEAYDGMYEQVSYLLGRAVARQMTSEEL
ncbi:DUF2059 domain-containing protein [Roseovarius aestuariivivens]|uniref:DUF2059 domain-containing protein n=1 Tax=Roseovarius aestuariivivens TaxID=1888910 RepID=UPI001081A00E|nr:DUF2059 domain-containing protein [Roseovarius aestuariivivens]